jgi:hypothetical protein
VVEIQKGIAAFLKVRNVSSRRCDESKVRHGQSCHVTSVLDSRVALFRKDVGRRLDRLIAYEPTYEGMNESRVSRSRSVTKHVF